MLAMICIAQSPIANAELDRHQVEEILAHRTNQYLADRGFRMSDDNWDFFKDAIEYAAIEIANLPSKEQPAEMERASSNIHLFIDVMSQEAELTAGYGKRLGETTLAAAKSSLCPIWPFC